MDTIQQLIRIVGYAAGGYFLGAGVADGEMFQAALAGLGSVATFLWWFFANRNAKK